MKRFLIVVTVILLAVGVWWWLSGPAESPAEPTVTSFTDCAEYYPVMESHPRRCQTPDGQEFIESIDEQLSHQDILMVETPRMEQAVDSPIAVSGQARGGWYFEATFPVTLRTADGQVLAETYAEAEGDWMTEDWVPFALAEELEFSVATPTPAEIVLEKANPSGLPENADQAILPVTLQP